MNKIYNIKQYTKEKYDYETLKNIFIEFWYDKEFLLEVYEEINEKVTEYWKMEFTLQILEKIKGKKIPKEEKIKKELDHEKQQIIDEIEKIMQEEYIPEFGQGFIFIESTFYYCNRILYFFAQYFIAKILGNQNLEEYLHRLYKSYKEVENIQNKEALLINYLLSKDSTLGYFCINHPELIKESMKYIEEIKEKWKNYNKEERIRETTNPISILTYKKKKKKNQYAT